MFSFLSRMRMAGRGSIDEDEDERILPPPATSKHLGHKRGESASSTGSTRDARPSQLNTLTISAPIPRSSPSSITGFDNDNIVAGPGGVYNGSSSASVSSGSAITAYQYPTSFSSLHQQQQHQSQRMYQNPSYSQPQMVSGHAQPRTGPLSVSSPEIGLAIGGDEEHENEMDMVDVSPDEQDRPARPFTHNPFPAVIRLDSYGHEDHSTGRGYAADQIGRSASAPPLESYAQGRTGQHQSPYFLTYGPGSGSPTSPSSPQSGRFNLRLDTNAEFAQGMQSLRLVDHATAASAMDVFAGAYDYPRAQQLSPIAEVEYVSPDSLKKTKSLPFLNNSSDISAVAFSRQDTNNTTNTNNNSPGGSVSQGSEVTRPSPVYSSPFITRPLKRTVSQTSSRTHASTTSSVVPPRITNTTAKSPEAPALPQLDFRPPFPGPHPSHPGSGPPLRPSKPQRQGASSGLSTIIGSEEGGSKYTTDDVASFVTASSYGGRGSGVARGTEDPEDHDSGSEEEEEAEEEEEEEEEEAEEDEEEGKLTVGPPLPSASGESRAELMSVNSGQSHIQSASESFIQRRWDSDAGFGIGGRVTVLRTKRQAWLDTTPAFWAFWLGFMCPFLWLIGGWHFTHFGEQPPRLTFWEFYFNAGYWKEMVIFCFGPRKRRKSLEDLERPAAQPEQAQEMARVSSQKRDKKRDPPPVTRWVAEKQPTEQRRERLNDPKRSMRGISFGYPFIPRPVQLGPRREDWLARALRRLSTIVTAPNRLFDHLYGVKLSEVRGRPESSRRMFDPWIQRCRYAFCYALILLSIGLCTVSAYLIVYNTRQLHS